MHPDKPPATLRPCRLTESDSLRSSASFGLSESGLIAGMRKHWHASGYMHFHDHRSSNTRSNSNIRSSNRTNSSNSSNNNMYSCNRKTRCRRMP